MPKHFQRSWTKWDFINDILFELFGANDTKELKQLEKSLNKLKKDELANFYHLIKEEEE
jgi:hypothetical protein